MLDGRKVKAVRKNLGMSQQDLVRVPPKTGNSLSVSTIKRIESSVNGVNVHGATARELAARLEVTLEDLLHSSWIQSPTPQEGESTQESQLNLIRATFNNYPVADTALLAGRTPTIERLLDVIATGGAHGLVHGPRGIGKSSVAYCLKQALEDGGDTRVVYVACWSRDRFEDLARRVLRESFGTDGEGCADLREALTMRLGEPTVVLIDEVDAGSEELAGDIASWIHYLVMKHIPSTVILLGSDSAATSIITGHKSTRREIRSVRLSCLDDTDIARLLDSRARVAGVDFSKEAAHRIKWLSCGMPFFANILGRYSSQHALEEGRLQVAEGNVERAAVSVRNYGFGLDIVEHYEELEVREDYQRLAGVLYAFAAASPKGADRGCLTSNVAPFFSSLLGKRSNARMRKELTDVLDTLVGDGLLWRRRERYGFVDAHLEPYFLLTLWLESKVDLMPSIPEERGVTRPAVRGATFVRRDTCRHCGMDLPDDDGSGRCPWCDEGGEA